MLTFAHARDGLARATLVLVLALIWWPASAAADTSKLGKETSSVPNKGAGPGKNKLCCGYPLSEERGFKMTFYWMAVERPSRSAQTVDVYTTGGNLLGNFDPDFVSALRMEGSGWLADGRVVNYAGRCRYGIGVCFDQLDHRVYPYGRGAFNRPLVPFRSVAVDRRLVAIGETLYLPELDGVQLPDGSFHDGCVRADDVGGKIRRRMMDFFVVEKRNFRRVQEQLWNDWWFTPHIEAPRCAYLRTE